MSSQNKPDAEWQTAYWVLTNYGIGAHRLKTLALHGTVKTKIDKTRWASCLYFVPDVKKYSEQHMTNSDAQSHAVAVN
jgi:hypothetical protein